MAISSSNEVKESNIPVSATYWKDPAEFSLRGFPYLSHFEAMSKILSIRFPEASFHSPSLYFLRFHMCDLYALKCKNLFK